MPDTQLSVTWVEVDPGASQKPHKHPPEQTYVIIQGRGVMHVGNESSLVQKGDLVCVPPNVLHSLENAEAATLTYISASTPADNFEALYDEGDLS